MSVMSIMITANFIMLGILIRFTHVWDTISELNKNPRYSPILRCIVVMIIFIIFIILAEMG